MRKAIVRSMVGVLVVGGGLVVGIGYRGYEELRGEVRRLAEERDALAARVETSERFTDEVLRELAARPRDLTAGIEPEAEKVERETFVPPEPQVTTDDNGKRSYFFPELHGPDGRVIAREAEFRELLGYTKLSFRTSDGIRYYSLDDVHPEVVRYLGYDAKILKGRLAEQHRQMQILGAQARLQQELRVKAAQEYAEREKAAAERLKAEAAMREAEARERLAQAAERAATNPPKPQRIYQKVIVAVPYSTNRNYAPVP